MDWLRSCYTTLARPFSDDEGTALIRWYFADDSAQFFPSPHAFGSNNWEDPKQGGIGEVPSAARPWYSGFNFRAYLGHEFCGQAEWYLDGAPSATPVLPLLLCCGDRGEGGFRLRGEVAFIGGRDLIPSGGFTFTGESMAAKGPYLLSPGGFTVTGESAIATGPTFTPSGGWAYTGEVPLSAAPLTTFASSGGFTVTGEVAGDFDMPLPGMIFPYGGNTAPSGYLLCDGSVYLRSTYPALFAAIGLAFGPADSTHFYVPDLRGRTPIGQDPSGVHLPLNAPIVGSSGGFETVTLITSQLPSHTHPAPGSHPFIQSAAGSAYYSTAAATTFGITTANTGSQGSDQPHENTQPWQAVLYIIKS